MFENLHPIALRVELQLCPKNAVAVYRLARWEVGFVLRPAIVPFAMQSWSLPLIACGSVLLLLALFSWGQPRALGALAQWSHAVWNLDEDADQFYERLLQLFDRRLSARPLPFSHLALGPRSLLATRTLFGGQALYLEARYRHLSYYVYACPMPGGLFVSTWLFSRMAGWHEHPVLKWVLWWRASRLTLFGFDCLEMFHLAVHGAVLDLLDDYARERGLPPLDEVARRPVLHGFYAKRKGAVPVAPGGLASSAPSPAPTALPFEVPTPPTANGAKDGIPASGPRPKRPSPPLYDHRGQRL